METSEMTVSVLTIGDEILSGEIHDANFGYIADRIASAGLSIRKHMTVPDDIEDISHSILGLVRESSVLVITGGLGPTTDDLTRESIAAAFKVQLRKSMELETYLVNLFESFGRKMPEQNLKQAMMPEGARIIEPVGTAAGIMLEHGGKLVIALPGVPGEMKAMFESDVLPSIEKFYRGHGFSRTVKLNVFGVGESDLEDKVFHLIGKSPVKYGFLASGGQVTVKLTASAATEDEVLKLLSEEKSKVYGLLGRFIYSEGDKPIEVVISELLKEKDMTLSAAESLTAGMVCDRIVNVPGSSDYFIGGVVAYSKTAKEKLLGIGEDALSDGAVNEKVAVKMAESVRKLFSTDIGVSTTGLAGPGAGHEKEKVGTVCIGLACAEGVYSWTRKLPGERSYVRQVSAATALNAVRLFLLGETGFQTI
ncbi:MAG: CinA family nicotinamide mononucleotide deamidase-related protein [Actinobacteria bacterium]|nr:CinA family nicotinamide mononucleotide deamidase-related protein [Actinomycetota bacterium]